VIEPDEMNYLVRQQRQAREQAAGSDDISLRIAHLARADQYGFRIATLKRRAQWLN